MGEEERLVAARRGKWSATGVPHRGWTCIDIEDRGEPRTVCEMCESRAIRYVHFMQHPKFGEVLAVGCVCAGNMEQDVAAANDREASMQKRSAKRMRWLTRKWRISARGNPWIRADGYRVTVYPRETAWAATVSSEDNSFVQHSRRIYHSIDQAKLAAFDLITRLLSGQRSVR
jgi:hypothetical protein